jgi:hypothetical protein
MQEREIDIRAFLIDEVFRFIDRVVAIPGVLRIALLGSLTSPKADPKDADILVTVEDAADLTDLATAGRKLKGSAQSRNKGADIFLADSAGRYIGRICHWRECGPGIRSSCDARHCGKRHYLHDDLDNIALDSQLIQAPPIVVWPGLSYRGEVPDDVMAYLSHFHSGLGV